MPSWNIHTAHAEKLLATYGAEALGICDENVFIFGNYVPDIYVGYLVQPISVCIDYKDTHLARKAYIPLPDYRRFWRRYVEPYGGNVPDLVLGVWCHLVCDNIYNAHTRTYINEIHVKPGEVTREGKQADFAAFGHTLDISRHVEATSQLIAQAAAFPQYAVAEEDVLAAVAAANRFVDDNIANHLDALPPLRLLTPEFFSDAFDEADRTCAEGLLALARADQGEKLG